MFEFDFQSAPSVREVAEDVISREAPEEGRIPLMVTPNVDQVVKLNRAENKALKKRLLKAQWILPDGQPIVAMSKIKFGRNGLETRLTGSDFFPVIWELLKQRPEVPVLFVLPNEELGERFTAERPNTAYYAPPFFDLKDEEAFVEVMDQVKAAQEELGAAYVFIGLGMPKQEHIAIALFDYLSSLSQPLPKTFLLGASFEFYWGVKKRAPKIYQKLGIEFVHRIITEPRRMAKRYLVDDLAIIPIGFRELFKKAQS